MVKKQKGELFLRTFCLADADDKEASVGITNKKFMPRWHNLVLRKPGMNLFLLEEKNVLEKENHRQRMVLTKRKDI